MTDQAQNTAAPASVPYYPQTTGLVATSQTPVVPTINLSSTKQQEEEDIQDTEEYVEEESLSLDDLEKEMIRKALEKHHGKRKNAAKDLNISERTLYRKIKEYGLD